MWCNTAISNTPSHHIYIMQLTLSPSHYIYPTLPLDLPLEPALDLRLDLPLDPPLDLPLELALDLPLKRTQGFHSATVGKIIFLAC